MWRMTTRRFLLIFLLLSVVFTGACAGGGSDAPPEDDIEEVADDGDLVMDFAEPGPQGYQAEVFGGEPSFDEDVDYLNGVLALPSDILINFRPAQDEGDLGPYYDPEEGAIHIQYEFVDVMLMILEGYGFEDEEELVATARSSLEFITYHELGHALIDQLGLPVTGREEDAADGLAMTLLLETYEEGGGQEVALATSDLFDALAAADDGAASFEDYADEHSLDEQRSIQIVCWVYGSDPEAYGSLVEDGYITEARAARCPEEHDDLIDAWGALLAPYWL